MERWGPAVHGNDIPTISSNSRPDLTIRLGEHEGSRGAKAHLYRKGGLRLRRNDAYRMILNGNAIGINVGGQVEAIWVRSGNGCVGSDSPLRKPVFLRVFARLSA